jgi:hypothetical protein
MTAIFRLKFGRECRVPDQILVFKEIKSDLLSLSLSADVMLVIKHNQEEIS